MNDGAVNVQATSWIILECIGIAAAYDILKNDHNEH